MFRRMDHAALSVHDMERAIAFYRDVIGFEVVFDRVFDEPLAHLIGEEGAAARVVHLRLGDAVLELFHYRHPLGRPRPAGQRQSDLGLTHIGFMVEDFEATMAHLRAHGVALVGEPVEIRPGVHVAYFYGPEGEVCEAREIVAGA